MSCLVDHGALTSPFCPKCGFATGPAREPGEVKMMMDWLTVEAINSVNGATPQIRGKLIAIVMCLEALKWTIGATTTEHFKLIIQDPQEAMKREQGR